MFSECWWLHCFLFGAFFLKFTCYKELPGFLSDHMSLRKVFPHENLPESFCMIMKLSVGLHLQFKSFFFTSPTSVTTSCQICSILSPKSLFLFKRLWTPINDFNHRKVVLDQMLKDHSTTSCWLIVSNKNIQNTSDRLFSEWKVWQRYFWLLKSGKTVHNRWCS